MTEPKIYLLDSSFRILQAGERLKNADLYWSSKDRWYPVPCPGNIIPKRSRTTFVRVYFGFTLASIWMGVRSETKQVINYDK